MSVNCGKHGWQPYACGACMKEARAVLDFFARLTRLGLIARSDWKEAAAMLAALGYEGMPDPDQALPETLRGKQKGPAAE